MHQLQHGSTHKICKNQQNYFLMGYPLDNLTDHHNQLENNQKSCSEKRHSPLGLKLSQYKLREYYNQNFLVEVDPLQNKCQGQNIELNLKSRTVKIILRIPSRKVSNLIKFVWDRKLFSLITRFTRLSVPLFFMMEIKVTKK